jgi:hypothetical protein
LDGITYAASLDPTDVDNMFILTAAHIVINGTPG